MVFDYFLRYLTYRPTDTTMCVCVCKRVCVLKVQAVLAEVIIAYTGLDHTVRQLYAYGMVFQLNSKTDQKQGTGPCMADSE
jgi:hypothetical protein